MSSKQPVFRDEFSETVIISEYKWIIYNFASVTEKVIKSKEFSNYASAFGKLQWNIQLYPDGENQNSKGYISLYLNSLNNFEVTVDYELSMSSSVRSYDTRSYSYTYKTAIGYGTRNFITRSTVLTDLKNGNEPLTITLKMFFNRKPQLKDHQLDLLKDLGSLLEMKEHCDVILTSSNGTEHKAHKLVLICRSKVFSAMFQHNMKESQDNVVKIEDVDDDTLEAMLQFMYTGEVKNMQNKTKELLIAADKYDLNNLRDTCIEHISEKITNHNILDLIEFAHTYNISDLKLRAKDYFLQNHKNIVSIKGRESIKNLSHGVMEDLLYDLASQ